MLAPLTQQGQTLQQNYRLHLLYVRHLTIPIRTKANIPVRLSILFRPRQKASASRDLVVEPPGTAPGSSPLRECAFIVIVGTPTRPM